jgi:hypothetical protein
MATKKHGIIIETPTEARQAERGRAVRSDSPDGKFDNGRNRDGRGLVHILSHLAVLQSAKGWSSTRL